MVKRSTISPLIETILRRHLSQYTERSKEQEVHAKLGWTNPQRMLTRYSVMAELIRWEKHHNMITVLDFGCGLGGLKEHLGNSVLYTGTDIMPASVLHCRKQYPHSTFHLLAIKGYENNLSQLGLFDYIVVNGVFTERLDVSYSHTWNYFALTIQELFRHTNHGIAFNVMSAHVENQREDLFHVPMDEMAEFVIENLSRNFIFRNDYGMYEYTVYVYK